MVWEDPLSEVTGMQLSAIKMITNRINFPAPLTCKIWQAPPASDNTASPPLLLCQYTLDIGSPCLQYHQLPSFQSNSICSFNRPQGNPPLSPQISLSPADPPVLFLLAWTDYSCPQPHLEVGLLCHGLSSACQSSWWWLSVWVLPRLVILEEVRAHLGSTWKRKNSLCCSVPLHFLWSHKAAHVLFRNLFWLVLSPYSSFPFLQRTSNPSKKMGGDNILYDFYFLPLPTPSRHF